MRARTKTAQTSERLAADNGGSSLLWIAGVAVALFLIELAPRSTPQGPEHWNYALHRLYDLPIITAGLRFGWRGGLVTAVGRHQLPDSRR